MHTSRTVIGGACEDDTGCDDGCRTHIITSYNYVFSMRLTDESGYCQIPYC